MTGMLHFFSLLLKVTIDKCLARRKILFTENRPKIILKNLNYHINDLSSLSGIKPGKWINNLNYEEFNEFTGK